MALLADSMQSDLKAMRLPLLGGNLCLDFINTAEHRGTAQHVEFLISYERLVAWCRHAALVSEKDHERLAKAAAKDPAQAAAVLSDAVALREALYRLFAGMAHGNAPTAAALKPLNAALLRPTAQRQLVPSQAGGPAAWRWPASTRLDGMLGPLTLTAAELSTASAVQTLRQCAGCGWLFLDTSRNHMRRWCSMAYCGNKMKSRRQYARKVQADVQ